MQPLLHYRNDDGSIVEIGPEHPDYAQLYAEYLAANPNAAPQYRVNRWEMLKISVLGLAISIVLFWLTYSEIRDKHRYSPKVEVAEGLLLAVSLVLLLLSAAPQKWITPQYDTMSRAERTTLAVAGIAVFVGGPLIAYFFHHWALNRIGLK